MRRRMSPLESLAAFRGNFGFPYEYAEHFSFAMENAHPDIKKAARFLTKSNEENGVTEVLQQMLDSMN